MSVRLVAAWLVLSVGMTAVADHPTAVNALIVTGDHPGKWQESTSQLRRVLEDAGHRVTVTEQPGIDLSPAKLAHTDVVILNYKRTDAGAKANPDSVWSEDNFRALAESVSSGMGLVVLDHASSAFDDGSAFAKEYEAMIAGGARKSVSKQSQRELDVTIQFDHPVTRGIKSFHLGHGTLVHSPMITDGSEVLATVFDGREQDEPVVWVNRYGRGRVVHNLVRHDAESLQIDSVKRLFEQSARWAGEKGFRMIFDGKTLDGWEGNLRYWSVQNGAIVGTRPHWKPMPFHDFLCTVERFDDFELRIEAKVIGQRNSGICVRTNRQRYTYPIVGYEIDMGVFRWGWIYEEGGKRQVLNRDVQAELQPKIRAVLKQGDFNDVVVRCIDHRIEAWINGVGFEFVETNQKVAERLRSGKIGLQLHDGKPQIVSFRNIRVKQLRQ